MSDEPATEAAPPPVAGGQPPSRSSNGLAIAGWITAVLFWPAGIVIGAILASREDKRGRWILGVSVAMILLYVLLFAVLQNAAEHHVVNDYYNNY